MPGSWFTQNNSAFTKLAAARSETIHVNIGYPINQNKLLVLNPKYECALFALILSSLRSILKQENESFTFFTHSIHLYHQNAHLDEKYEVAMGNGYSH